MDILNIDHGAHYSNVTKKKSVKNPLESVNMFYSELNNFIYISSGVKLTEPVERAAVGFYTSSRLSAHHKSFKIHPKNCELLILSVKM